MTGLNSEQNKKTFSFDDRRKYPRLQIHLPIKIRTKPGKYVHAKIFDLSPDGLQIRCDRDTGQLIHPVEEAIDFDNKPIVVVAFNIPHHKGEKEIIVRCKICYKKLLNQGSKVAFGVKFTCFKENCDKYISQYFAYEMEPAYQ